MDRYGGRNRQGPTHSYRANRSLLHLQAYLGLPSYPPWLKPGTVFVSNGGALYRLVNLSTHGRVPDRNPHKRGALTLQRRFLWNVGDHSFKRVFQEHLYSTFMDICRSSGLDVETVGCYRVGPTDAGEWNPVTIVVGLFRSGTQRVTIELAHPARLATSQIHRALASLSYDEIQVEVVAPAEPYSSPCESNDPVRGFNDLLHSGSSIGPAGTDFSGTLSGCVGVQGTDGRTIVFGLTCHHVVAMGRTNRLAALSAADGVQATTPSKKDFDKTIAKLEDVVRDNGNELRTREAARASREMQGGSVSTHMLQNIETSREAVAAAEAEIARWRRHWDKNQSLGQVFLSSGITSLGDDKPLNDFALVEIDESRLPKYMAGKIHPATKQHLEDAWEYVETACNQVGAPIPEVAEGGELPAMLKFCCPVEETCVPRSKVMELLQSKETVHVYMHGRSNLFSVGVLHDIKNGVLTKYPIGSRSGTEYIVAAQALVIKSPPSPSPTTAAAFSAAGDSGSVVRLKDGKILGFLYCSVNSNYSNSTVSHVVLGEDVGKGIADMLNARNVDFKTASLHSMI